MGDVFLKRKKKILVVTGSRSEYGLFYNILKLIKSSKELDLLLVVTGMHLSPEFGYTVNEIIQDGFSISEQVEMVVSSDNPVGIAKSMGLGMIGFADCFKRLQPDLLLILGDRYEIFAAASAAMALNIPIAHISGGDLTEWTMDEQIRHAITKMSHLHFVAIEQHAERVRQMGEEKWRVNVVGEPCIDNINSIDKLTKGQISKILGINFNRTTVLVTYHPVTLEVENTTVHIQNLLKALDRVDAEVVFTYPNADSGGRVIISKIENFRKTHPNTKVFKSLGVKLYLNLLSHVDVIVGNSSSGIVEAPSFKVPAVNIGKRQQGRLFAENTICTTEETESISRGIEKALSHEFRKSLLHMKNPYDKGGAAKKIIRVLTGVEITPKLRNKKFIEDGRNA